MTVIHLLVKANPLYMPYAAMCAESLIRRGNVRPETILVSVGEDLRNARGFRELASLGVTITLLPGAPVAKFVWVDKLFQAHPEVSQVVQLDTDVLLTEDVDLPSKMRKVRTAIAVYEQPSDGREIFRSRACLCRDGFRHAAGGHDRERFAAMARGLFNVDLDDLEGRLTTWVFGGMSVINRHITRLPVWRAMIAASWLTVCDETIIQLARPALAGHFGFLRQEWLAHRVNPEVFNLDQGPGMIHYAGRWYRHDNEDHRRALEARFTALFP